MTTTRGEPCAIAGIGSVAAAATAAVLRRKSRRVLLLGVLRVLTIASLLLRREPGRDRLELVVGVALRDAIHHRRGLGAVAERGHQRHDVFGFTAVDLGDWCF